MADDNSVTVVSVVTETAATTFSGSAIFVTKTGSIEGTNNVTWSLNTIFTPPQSCLTNIFDFGGLLTLAPTGHLECYPNSVYTIFSPGVCPYGYTAAAGTVNVVAHSGTTSTTTTYNCCPSCVSHPTVLKRLLIQKRCRNFAYIATDTYLGQCQSSIDQPLTKIQQNGGIPLVVAATSVHTIAVMEESFTVNSTESSTIVFSLNSSLVVSTYINIFAPPIQIQYQATDTEVAVLWSSIFAANKGAAAPSSTTNPSGVLPSSSPSPVHKSSPGVIAGAAAGGVLALLLVISLVVLLLRKRRRTFARGGNVGWEKQELGGKQVEFAELDGDREIKELNVPPTAAVELPGHGLEATISELRGSPNTPTRPNERRLEVR